MAYTWALLDKTLSLIRKEAAVIEQERLSRDLLEGYLRYQLRVRRSSGLRVINEIDDDETGDFEPGEDERKAKKKPKAKRKAAGEISERPATRAKFEDGQALESPEPNHARLRPSDVGVGSGENEMQKSERPLLLDNSDEVPHNRSGLADSSDLKNVHHLTISKSSILNVAASNVGAGILNDLIQDPMFSMARPWGNITGLSLNSIISIPHESYQSYPSRLHFPFQRRAPIARPKRRLMIQSSEYSRRAEGKADSTCPELKSSHIVCTSHRLWLFPSAGRITAMSLVLRPSPTVFLGLEQLQIRVKERPDGQGYIELEDGHAIRGKDPSRMCGSCTKERVVAVECTSHAMRPIEGVDAQTFDLTKAFKTLFADLGEGRCVKRNPWCAICISPAFYQCVGRRGKAGTRGGCGLLLCDSCAWLVHSHDGDISGVIEAVQDAGGNLRADAEFLLPKGELYRRYITDNAEEESEQS
ncbi:predicted protein [Uncinocarpus reesii 1704]|uniref:Uncharacterized protein n=1 Tax=Uncinocarpus reesii (strain UAMH 1704) TaxID=336963 RepID=C4JXA2_UNCRE|nr:uncharacterized protein UREG_06275 [Uncinocarpus reesii 1704]EEP81410.1 predicted protein [Uncinocarpus reesii 1704]